MKFKILRSKFVEGLKTVQGIVPTKGTLPVLSNVRIECSSGEMTLTTTDLDISIKTVVACEVLEEGATTIPMKLLFNSVSKAAEGEIEVEVDYQDRTTIKAGSAKFKLVGLPESDFPKLPQDEEAYAYQIEQTTLREMLRKVSYAASQDDTRRTLKGVLMSFKDKKITMVATDGRRLAMVEQECEFPKDMERDIILPSKAVQELQRSMIGEETASVKVQKSQVSFKIGSVMIYSKLIEDSYPNYRQVIPGPTEEKIEVDRQLFLDALERANVMTMDEAHSTKLIFSESKLTVTSAANDLGEAKDEVPIKYAGKTIEIIFNPSYVMDPLKAIDDDTVTININNGHSPAVISCGIPFIYVLMPLRIN